MISSAGEDGLQEHGMNLHCAAVNTNDRGVVEVVLGVGHVTYQIKTIDYELRIEENIV